VGNCPLYSNGEFMIYLKNIGGNIAVLKDSDTKEAKNLVESGLWHRVNGRKDFSPYSEPKKASKKGK
tara:strand:+ start:6940 stop:7140 length:201 start_codon:yes stop_codon:yes gene_type:complete